MLKCFHLFFKTKTNDIDERKLYDKVIKELQKEITIYHGDNEFLELYLFEYYKAKEIEYDYSQFIEIEL